MDRERFLQSLLPLVGGKENTSLCEFHGETLYVTVKDASLVESERIKALPGAHDVRIGRSRVTVYCGAPEKKEEIFAMANKIENCSELARTIIRLVGGKENITQVQHCATRLRFQLNQTDLPDTEKIKATPGVINVIVAMGQYQVVIGNSVADVYNEVCRQLGTAEKAPAPAKAKEKKNAGAILMEYLQAIIGPIMAPFTAGGILKGLLAVAVLCGMDRSGGLYVLLSAIADGIYYFLPVFIGYSTAEKAGMTPVIGMLIGAIMCYPTINGVDLSLFGFTFNGTYTSTFLPVLLIVLITTPLEKWLQKKLPGVIRGFSAPLLTLLVAIPLGFCVIGPIANAISAALASAVNALYSFSPLLVGILTGAFWQVLVVFGLHGMMMTACMLNIINGTGDMLLAISIFICFAQSATVLAMALRSSNKEFKNMAYPTVVSGIFGVTEPAIYGITLPHIKYFVISCIGGVASGIVCALFGVKKYSFGSGIFALPTMINTENPQILPLVLAAAAAVGVSFVLAFVLFNEKDLEPAAQKE